MQKMDKWNKNVFNEKITEKREIFRDNSVASCRRPSLAHKILNTTAQFPTAVYRQNDLVLDFRPNASVEMCARMYRWSIFRESTI